MQPSPAVQKGSGRDDRPEEQEKHAKRHADSSDSSKGAAGGAKGAERERGGSNNIISGAIFAVHMRHIDTV